VSPAPARACGASEGRVPGRLGAGWTARGSHAPPRAPVSSCGPPAGAGPAPEESYLMPAASQAALYSAVQISSALYTSSAMTVEAMFSLVRIWAS